MSEFKSVIVTPDGAQFDTKSEAMDHLRKPKILAALVKLTDSNTALSEWLLENQDAVESAFDTGSIKRVTKSERKKLVSALEAVAAVAAESDNKALSFLADNTEAVVESFRWPTVKRMTDEEKVFAARNTLIAASAGNEELATWAIENKDAILEAYEAGKIKREVSPKATEALAAYRAKKAEEKAAKEASETEEKTA